MNNRRIGLRLLAGLLTFCVLCPLMPPLPTVAAAEEAVYTAGDVSFSAGLYFDADRASLDTPLTQEGSKLTDWEYDNANYTSTDRYLWLQIDGMSTDKQYRFVIEMDPVLYVNLTDDPSSGDATITAQRNDPFTVNTDGEYTPHKYSYAQLTYTLNEGLNALTMSLPFRFTPGLWDKQNGSGLGDGETPLLKFTLMQENGEGVFEPVGPSVSLKQITVSGQLSYETTTSSYLVGGSSVATDIMGAEGTLKTIFSYFSSNNLGCDNLIKDLKVSISLPVCTVSGTTHRLKYSNVSLSTANGTPVFTESYDEETGVVQIRAEQMYFKSSKLFEILFSAPEALKSVPGNYTFYGKVSVSIDGRTLKDHTFAIRLDTNTEAVLKAHTVNGKANVLDLEAVQLMGTLAMRNDSALNGSGPLWIELSFDTNETNHVSVTTVNLMCDRDTEMISIEYTLVDRDGNPAFEGRSFTTSVKNPHYSPGKTITEAHYLVFSRNNLPADHRAYYFKMLSYSMGNLPGNSKAYHAGASSAAYSAGTIWGYVNISEMPAIKPVHRITLYTVDGEEKNKVFNATCSSVFDNGTGVSYGLEAAALSSNSVNAGGSVTISGRVFVIRYPYTSNACLNDIRLGLLLPKGVTVNTASITAKYVGGTLEVANVTPKPVSATDVFYIIEFKRGEKIGYYNETLGALPHGNTLSFSLQLNSDSTMSTRTINLRECVFVAGYKRSNGAGGSYSKNAVKDTYDLTGDGRTGDNVGCFASAGSVTFFARPAELDITDSLINSKGESGSNVPMENFADIVTYQLQVKCIEGGTAKDFYYIIPIAKKGFDLNSNFVEQCDITLAVSSAPTLHNQQGTPLKLRYCFDEVKNYDQAYSAQNWVETLPSGKTWEEVTAIKVIADGDIINNGSVSVISVPLKYTGEDTEYPQLAGMKIRWHSRGYYHYTIGSNSTAGIQSTDGCTITLQYTPEVPKSITLTAAKGEPLDGSKTASFVLPQFILAQSYSIKHITPFNVNLMDGTYDFSSASSAEANENFRIKVSVKNSATDEVGSPPVPIKKDDTLVGSLPRNTAPEFIFTIENANALSDIVTERTVALTLVGDNGVIVPVFITIRRELAAAEATSSAIVAGKVFVPFEGKTSAVVSADSAFTAQFVTKDYIPANYQDLKLVFENGKPLAEGTTITMIDWTDSASLKYYHYTADGTSTEIPLKSFKVMGENGFFTESQSTAVTTERLLFLVSFPEAGETCRTNTVSLQRTIKSGTDDTAPASLTFQTVKKREFSLSTSQVSVSVEEEITLDYKTECSVSDSRYTNRNFSLVISSGSSSALPVNSYVKVGDSRYYMSGAGTFLIPLPSVQEGDGTVTLSFHSPTVKSATLKIELWASATADGSAPMMGNAVAAPVNLAVSDKTKPSLRVDFVSDRLLHTEELTTALTVKLKTQNADTITVECQRKIGAAYVTQTNVIEAVNDVTQGDYGVFKCGLLADGTVVVKLSGETSPGTYRLLLKAYNDNETIQVPISLIVLE